MEKDYLAELANLGLTKKTYYYPSLTEFFGSASVNMVFSQLLAYASSAQSETFPKTDDELCSDSGLTLDVLKTARKKLIDLGFITTQRKGIPAKLYYTVQISTIEQRILSKFGNI